MAEQDRNNRSNTIPIIGSEFVRPQPSDLTIIRDTVKHANRNKVTSKHDRWQVYRGSNLDDKIFTVKRSSSVQLKTRVEVFLKQPDKEVSCDFNIKGRFMKLYVCNIQVHEGHERLVATVYPNVDCAFIVTLIFIFDLVIWLELGPDCYFERKCGLRMCKMV
ncbi:unnamed protein product [Brassica oleracea var. botrytis]